MVLKNITLSGIRYAIYLIPFFITACIPRHNTETPIAVIWTDSIATGISISKALVGNVLPDSLQQDLTVHVLTPEAGPPMLGEYNISNGEVVFKPLIPFTRGLSYEVRLKNKRLGEVVIPAAASTDGPQVIGVFPSRDTLPQNLLKLYVHFSKPMQAGHALRYITLVKNARDTLADVFLDLQPELWNHDGTLLTLWLDPGRIKRGLQPNEKLGEPLEQGAHYQLVVGGDWKDTRGATLRQSFLKNFVVSLRDTVSPAPSRWTITAPGAGTRNPLLVNFHEPLDHVLVREAIGIYRNDQPIRGKVETIAGESIYRFIPDNPWTTGSYTLSSEARLEDLAGNNLERGFDVDLRQNSAAPQRDYVRKFEIE
ncbi:hypothetical protein KK083_29260 [Fulvivirgaceae bacterium PWU4]|uniref:SbsA Ig-like domain-containing protein n=1 Tax=Chryseosolibacter histidini TaxID=2782349 RepID=A0AAP2GRC3_9BACT|nr:hypothetical protein [Chryseosolibacter histidini]MBT1701018.1 hypothetical protein [Chryseosolibacter histidini]